MNCMRKFSKKGKKARQTHRFETVEKGKREIGFKVG